MLAAALILAAMAQAAPIGAAQPITYSQNYDPTLSSDGKRMILIKLLGAACEIFVAPVP